MKKFYAAIAAIVLTIVLATMPAFAIGVSGTSEPCVPQDAYTEVVVLTPAVPATPGTPAVPAVPGTPAVPAVTQTIPAVAGFWQNFSPNNQQGPFIGPPTWPTDLRGTWQGPHTNGGPQQDAQGVFQNGQGNGSWFYRQQPVAEQVIIITSEIPAVPGTPAIPAVPATPEVPAVTETIVHDAVVCDDEPVDPPVPADPPTDPPTDTPEPSNPVEPNVPDEPVINEPGAPSVVTNCVGNDLMVQETDAQGNTSTYYVDGKCGNDVVKEEGM